MDAESLLGEQVLDVLRPFHDAQAAAVDVIVETDVQSFPNVFYTIEIEVVHRFSGARPVFIDDCESGRTYGVFLDPEAMAQGACEGGLPGSHGGIEGQDPVVAYLRKEFFRSSSDVLEVPYDD